jgi:iron complex transport system ATP-binding protein
MNESILRFEHVTYRYTEAANNALEDLSLDIPRGQVTAVLGPNGAGKTTLLRLAYGRYAPTTGRVLLEGRPLTNYSRQELGQRMALVPQREANPFAYSLLDYVLLGRAPFLSPLEMPGDEDVYIARQALATVGLEAMAQRSLLALSGGEHQLVLIARALAQQPRLLLLDEPTSHLDLANKKRLIECLRNLAHQGVSILMTSHEPEVVATLAEHIVLMNGGRVIAAGPLEAIWQAETLSAVYGVALRVQRINGQYHVFWA